MADVGLKSTSSKVKYVSKYKKVPTALNTETEGPIRPWWIIEQLKKRKRHD
jgi:hypothetical protein